MEKKIIILLEILFVLGALGYYTVRELIPEYRESQGSSDAFLKVNEYQTMMEIEVDQSIRFALVLNSDETLIHLFFFHPNCECLYNQNLEGKSLKEGIQQLIPILIQNDFLKTNSRIFITRYSDDYYSDFLSFFQETLRKYDVIATIEEKENTLSNLCQEFELSTSSSDRSMLRSLDFYSKEFIRVFKNHLQKTSISSESGELSDHTVLHYGNIVYQKMENMVREQQIRMAEKNDPRIDLTAIEARDSYSYYPTANSWYYVMDGHIYAYLEFVDQSQVYSVCYMGSIDQVKEGECS